MLPHEQQHPQPLELDMTVWLEPNALQLATIKNFLDYRDLYRLVAETVEERHHGLLEELCEAVATKALALEGVHSVRIGARKPHAMIAGPLDYVEVSIDRKR
jgi:dihydroneopterin aldolase